MPQHGVSGKLMQGGFKIEICLLAGLKKANGSLSFLIG